MCRRAPRPGAAALTGRRAAAGVEGRARGTACVLAIGGVDPGGGAGLAADVRAVGRAGAFAAPVVAVVTVQSTHGLVRVRALSPRELRDQADEVLAHQRVRAVKTGALGSAANVAAVAALLAAHPRIPAVIDPVLVPSRGAARLLDRRALRALREDLVPRAALVTANAIEAAAITGLRVATIDDARAAAAAICAMGARAALVKGGHIAGAEGTDVLARGRDVTTLRATPLAIPKIHGGGCTLASLIAGRVARRDDVLTAVRWARRAHRALLLRARDVGGPLRVLG